MNGYDFTFCGAHLTALGSGALWWPEQKLICVSDLHLGKSERRARLGSAPLPPYETCDTLARLETDLRNSNASTVVCLGDSFDDRSAAEALPTAEKLWISALQSGRRWIWIEGNHDPGPLDLGGSHLAELSIGTLYFRHVANRYESCEISGHYHPKLTLPMRSTRVTRPVFLIDEKRIIMPAYGTYTGGLRSNDSTLQSLMGSDTLAVLTGATPHPVPLPRRQREATSD